MFNQYARFAEFQTLLENVGPVGAWTRRRDKVLWRLCWVSQSFYAELYWDRYTSLAFCEFSCPGNKWYGASSLGLNWTHLDQWYTMCPASQQNNLLAAFEVITFKDRHLFPHNSIGNISQIADKITLFCDWAKLMYIVRLILSKIISPCPRNQNLY